LLFHFTATSGATAAGTATLRGPTGPTPSVARTWLAAALRRRASILGPEIEEFLDLCDLLFGKFEFLLDVGRK
jgi:hypothetical protein